MQAWAADNEVELVFLPTYGSWPNWIDSEFTALRYFALNGTDHRSHDEQNAAINAYIRRHNAHAEPKTNFAPGLTHPNLDPLPGQGHMTSHQADSENGSHLDAPSEDACSC